MPRTTFRNGILLVAAMALIPSLAQADTLRRNWDNAFDRQGRYERFNTHNDYKSSGYITSPTGERYLTRTKHEESRDGYTNRTVLTGPDGQRMIREEEVETDGSKLERRIMTITPDGERSIEKQTYRVND